MSQLSPELQELVLACKLAGVPTEADSARILSALSVCLGDAVVFGSETTLATGTSFSILFGQPSAMGLAGLALIGGMWFLATVDTHESSSASDSLPTTAAMSSLPVDSDLLASAFGASKPLAEVTSGPATVVRDQSERAQARPTAVARKRDTLSEEVALLSRAQSALRGRKPDQALELLNEHEHRFVAGLLTEERIAARVQALCALGRSAEANTQLAQLAPQSIHGAPARHACNAQKE